MIESADEFFSRYMKAYLAENRAAGLLAESLKRCGTGIMPLVDHCTLRTRDVDRRAKQVVQFGYRYDDTIGVLEFDNWWAKVYRKPGFPALFIDQAFAGERGRDSLIPEWVAAHGEECFHHIALRVEDIDAAIDAMESRGVEFAGTIVGEKGSDLRQIFTRPELRDGKVFTVLELIERHNGYEGFLPPQADGLMQSTRKP
ncbi:MAG: VOC family protein [Nitrospinales bacterium]